MSYQKFEEQIAVAISDSTLDCTSYIITHHMRGKQWYLFDVDARKGDIKNVLWSENITAALQFSNESEAEDIVDRYLETHKNVTIATMGETDACIQ